MEVIFQVVVHHHLLNQVVLQIDFESLLFGIQNQFLDLRHVAFFELVAVDSLGYHLILVAIHQILQIVQKVFIFYLILVIIQIEINLHLFFFDPKYIQLLLLFNLLLINLFYTLLDPQIHFSDLPNHLIIS